MRPIRVVDLGGTQLRTALVDHDGRLLVHHAKPTPRDSRTDRIEVVRAALGDDAGLAGAAGWSDAVVREAPSHV